MHNGSIDPLTRADIRRATLIFTVLALVITVPLFLFRSSNNITNAGLLLPAAACLFWGVSSLIAFHGFWEAYYQYFYPGWIRRFGVLSGLLYGLMVIAYQALQLGEPRFALLAFLGLGGLEGVLEHILGIYGFKICEKVPWLKGLSVGPLLLFSFVEYVVYWGLVAWLTIGLMTLF